MGLKNWWKRITGANSDPNAPTPGFNDQGNFTGEDLPKGNVTDTTQLRAPFDPGKSKG